MGKVVLVTGGARSGKSSYALQTASEISSTKKTFIATAVVFDDEMRLRADNHQAERGADWRTIEAPYTLSETVLNLPQHTVAVVDCCSVWLGNIWYKFGDTDQVLSSYIDDLCNSISRWKEKSTGTLIFVTNEVGWGIIPGDAATRRYRDWAGRLNQRIAQISQEVYLCVAGIAMTIKKEPS